MALRVIQISDPHLYANKDAVLYGMNTYQSLLDVISSIQSSERELDFVVVTGDLVHDETKAGYQRLVTCLERFNLPCYVIPGNHDDPNIMRSEFSEGLVKWESRVCTKHWQCLFLNSHVAGEVAGVVDEQEYQQLESYLANNVMPTVIFIHHPPLAVGSAWLDNIALKNSDGLLSIVSKYSHIKIVANGHIHQSFEYVDDNDVHFYGTPSTCMQFKPHCKSFELDNAMPGWRVFEFHQDGSFQSHIERL